MSCSIQIEKLLKSSDKNPHKSGFIKNWLNQNWDLYIDTADNNSCSHRQSPYPCFCCIRKDDCLFCDIYKKLSVIENYDSLNKKCTIHIENYRKIKTDKSKVQVWLKQNLDLGLYQLNQFRESDVIRRSFINGNDRIKNEFDYIFIFISLNEFNYNFEFKNLFDKLFFDQQLIKNEYDDYFKKLEQINKS
jgi:hypothetical protein